MEKVSSSDTNIEEKKKSLKMNWADADDDSSDEEESGEHNEPQKGPHATTQSENHGNSEIALGGPYRVVVRNLEFHLNEHDLRHFFDLGNCHVKSIELIKDKLTQQSKGCAYVEFEDFDSYEKALKEGNGRPLKTGGRVLTINVAHHDKKKFSTSRDRGVSHARSSKPHEETKWRPLSRDNRESFNSKPILTDAKHPEEATSTVSLKPKPPVSSIFGEGKPRDALKYEVKKNDNAKIETLAGVTSEEVTSVVNQLDIKISLTAEKVQKSQKRKDYKNDRKTVPVHSIQPNREVVAKTTTEDGVGDSLKNPLISAESAENDSASPLETKPSAADGRIFPAGKSVRSYGRGGGRGGTTRVPKIDASREAEVKCEDSDGVQSSVVDIHENLEDDSRRGGGGRSEVRSARFSKGEGRGRGSGRGRGDRRDGSLVGGRGDAVSSRSDDETAMVESTDAGLAQAVGTEKPSRGNVIRESYSAGGGRANVERGRGGTGRTSNGPRNKFEGGREGRGRGGAGATQHGGRGGLGAGPDHVDVETIMPPSDTAATKKSLPPVPPNSTDQKRPADFHKTLAGPPKLTSRNRFALEDESSDDD